jgi:ribonucleoside-diphosphate reductase alpha chain
MYGPQNPVSEQVHHDKHRIQGELFYDAMRRISGHLCDPNGHRAALDSILLGHRFLPAGRIQSSVGNLKDVTAYNCFVSGILQDSMQSIMLRATQAAETMRRGGGIGYDFSRIRPRGDRIVSLDSSASGPVSFMGIFDAVCQTIMSAGHRRGAMMATLRIDHPDIMEFIRAKQNTDKLKNFNISVLVTDDFMYCLEDGHTFPLIFEGRVYSEVDPTVLWDEIMKSNWDYAEPGVLFIDAINEDNNLNYCEEISSTNPCAEQPLPPWGACLLGSFNLVKYLNLDSRRFNWSLLKKDIPQIVRMMDNVIDRTTYPHPEQEKEAKAKRRMGLGITGLANAGNYLGYRYGDQDFIKFTKKVCQVLRDESYRASSLLAGEKGSFPMYKEKLYMESRYIERLPDSVKESIRENGIRNSHLTSIAPTGTISFTADNVSSGIEPVFALSQARTYRSEVGETVVNIPDYGMSYLGVAGDTVEDLDTDAHLRVLLACTPYIDSSISKTTNVGGGVTYEEFKDIYSKAWRGGSKGCTTYRPAGKREGILKSLDTPEGAACFIDEATGQKECS